MSTKKIPMNEKGSVVRYDDLMCGILQCAESYLIIRLIDAECCIRLKHVPKMGMWLSGVFVCVVL